MIVVVGASGVINDVDTFLRQLLTFSNKHNLTVQAFNANMIYSSDHLISATTHAKRAFQQGTHATGSLALEILLYAAAERQIQKAIKKIGIRKGKQNIAFVLTDYLDNNIPINIDETVKEKLLAVVHLSSDDTVIQGDRMTLKRFGITEKELSTVPKKRYGDLILEKIALVDIIKK
ncbi:hypothetical protein AYK25_05580 [Thermoplasmatales archaeon SM1-50]|nr:MAG: hypothetical protein AYK25_05580 [Thermoplasmatales archaeon SM1-50]